MKLILLVLIGIISIFSFVVVMVASAYNAQDTYNTLFANKTGKLNGLEILQKAILEKQIRDESQERQRAASHPYGVVDLSAAKFSTTTTIQDIIAIHDSGIPFDKYMGKVRMTLNIPVSLLDKSRHGITLEVLFYL